MTWFIVTIKDKKNPEHNPHDKKVGRCSQSDVCTDSTGEHHSFIVEANQGQTAEEVRRRFAPEAHVTRVEEVGQVPSWWTPELDKRYVEQRSASSVQWAMFIWITSPVESGWAFAGIARYDEQVTEFEESCEAEGIRGLVVALELPEDVDADSNSPVA